MWISVPEINPCQCFYYVVFIYHIAFIDILLMLEWNPLRSKDYPVKRKQVFSSIFILILMDDINDITNGNKIKTIYNV